MLVLILPHIRLFVRLFSRVLLFTVFHAAAWSIHCASVACIRYETYLRFLIKVCQRARLSKAFLSVGYRMYRALDSFTSHTINIKQMQMLQQQQRRWKKFSSVIFDVIAYVRVCECTLKQTSKTQKQMRNKNEEFGLELYIEFIMHNPKFSCMCRRFSYRYCIDFYD